MKTSSKHITLMLSLLSRGGVACAVAVALFLSLFAATTLSAKERRNERPKKEATSKKEESGRKDESGKVGPEKMEPENTEEMERLKAVEEYELGLKGYDETSVMVDVQKLGGKEVNTLMRNNTAYLSVADIFDFLKIKNVPSPTLDSITGFFIEPSAVYTIDKVHNQIRYKGKVWDLNADDLIQTSSHLYLRSDYFNTIFGLECEFDAYNLSVKLNTNLEVPAVFEKRQEEIRSNLAQIKGTIKADTTIRRTYPGFHFGMADWFIYTQQQDNKNDVRATLALGGVVLGGETNVGLNYNSGHPFDEKGQYYLWRYVNNENPLVRQVMAGKISTSTVSSIYSPIVGMQVTNRATTYRRSFGMYTITDVTGPNWTVELYVNNVLVDYTRADASGFFSLDVPLVYGSSDVKLRFYGQYGELQTREQHIEIPVNFLPSHETEYTVSSGLVEDGKNSVFARSVVNYGVNRGMTVGGGLEYLSSVTSGNYMPFVNTSLKLLSNMYFFGEYTYGVRGKGTINYRLPSNIQFELNYIKYSKGQKAVLFNYEEERKGSVAIPIRFTGFSGLTRLSLNQILLPGNIKEWLGEWLISSSFSRASVNLTTYLSSIKQSESNRYDPNVYSNISVSVRLPFGLTVTPQAQYDYIRSQFISYKCAAEKLLFRHGFLNMSYEHYPLTNASMGSIGFRYDLAFTKVGATVAIYDKTTQYSQSAAGSLIHDRKSNYLAAGNRIAVGKAGIAVLPYLDVNNNGHFDEGEPKVGGVKVLLQGGLISYSERDSIFHITDLEPYAGYLLQINSDGVENIAWQTKNKTIRVTPNANDLTLVEVPFTVVGEVSGTVSVKVSENKKERGIGQVLVDIFNSDSVFITRTMTEADGYFSYNGLHAGNYFLCIDTAQLRQINYTSLTGIVPITISKSSDGDLVDGIKFTIKPNFTLADEDNIEVKKLPFPKQDATAARSSEYSILIDVTDDISVAGKIKTKLVRSFKRPVAIKIRHEDYIIQIEGFETREDAEEFVKYLETRGFKEALVIKAEK